LVDPRQRSKKRSGSNKPRKGFTLYLCHNLDYDSVAKALERSGIRFKRHREFFSGEVPDTTLLPKVGQHRWVLVTFDQKQRTRTIEAELIKRYRIRYFVFTSSQIGDVGELLTKASKAMRNLCKRKDGPFCASISKSGNVALRALR
jgi:PIN like domain